MTELERDIQDALHKDVDLTPEEYRKKNAAADAATRTHGVKGRAALTEGQRHKRIQMNFYGTVLNVLVSVLAEVSETNKLLHHLIAKEGENGKRNE